MADLAPERPSDGAAGRYLTFRVDQRLYALPAEEISEIILIPQVARVPQSPPGLLGVANLRGSILPLASLRGLLGRGEAPVDRFSRAIVLDGPAPVALAVDAVEALVSADGEQVETRQAELAAEPGERLRGAFTARADEEVARILDVQGMLADSFVQRPRARRQGSLGVGAAAPAVADDDDGAHQMLVVFEVAGQDYALELHGVQEIAPAPRTLTLTPETDALVLGLTAFRDTLLPLLSLRALLGFAPAETTNDRDKVIVTRVAGVLVGLVADRVRAVVRAPAGLIDTAPPVLAARSGGESRIKSIYRAEGGRRLISILAPDQLFREDIMQRLERDVRTRAPEAAEAADGQGAELQFLVFRLGEEEFGLPIGAVDEVAAAPDQITRVPRTPKFLEGVVNLRGEVLPVVDQRRRFDMPAFAGDARRRRLVVVRTERHRAGLIVDSVSEVLRSAAAAIEPAPELAQDTTPLVDGVINLETAGRMVLLLNPAELLSRAERSLLDAFQAAPAQDPQ